MSKFLKIFLLSFILLVTTSCTKGKNVFYRQDYFGYLDTIGYVIVEYNNQDYSETEVKDILKGLNDILLEVEMEFSIEQTPFMKSNNILSSTLMKINQNSGIQPVSVSDSFIELLDIAINYAEETNGFFDPTIGSLSTLWDITSKAEFCRDDLESLKELCEIPSASEIEGVLPLIDYHLIEINYETKEVFLPKKGMILDFGAIGKGYAAEKMREYLKKYQFSYSIINMGGNVLLNGEPLSKVEKIKIDVANPFETGTIGYYYPDINTGGVTSGVYERYINYEGTKYHHILNPKTGYPVQSDIVSVTIMGPNSCIADALSTSIFSLGAQKGIDYINTLDGYEAIIVTSNQQVYLSNNMNFILEEKLQIIK